jgi:hypothetical protein
VEFVALERSAFADSLADTGTDVEEAEDSVVGTTTATVWFIPRCVGSNIFDPYKAASWGWGRTKPSLRMPLAVREEITRWRN